MDEDTKANQDRDDAREYLRRVNDTYIFNPTSGLYQPKTKQPENKENQDAPQQKEQPPVLVSFDGERHWVANVIALGALVVSTFTLILLYYTVQYARKQWHEERRTADASITAAEAARRSADSAANNLVEYKRQFDKMFREVQRQTSAAVAQTEPVLRIEVKDVSAKTVEPQIDHPAEGWKWLHWQAMKDRRAYLTYAVQNQGVGAAMNYAGVYFRGDGLPRYFEKQKSILRERNLSN
jgi:hypothetical protein